MLSALWKTEQDGVRRVGIGILTRTVGDRPPEKVTFKQRLAGAEGLTRRRWRKSSPGCGRAGVWARGRRGEMGSGGEWGKDPASL